VYLPQESLARKAQNQQAIPKELLKVDLRTWKKKLETYITRNITLNCRSIKFFRCF